VTFSIRFRIKASNASCSGGLRSRDRRRLIESLSFPCFRRVATMIMVPGAPPHHSSMRCLSISSVDLADGSRPTRRIANNHHPTPTKPLARPAIMPTPHQQGSPCKYFPHVTSNRGVAGVSVSSPLVQTKVSGTFVTGPHTTRKIAFRNRRAQSGTGQEEVLTARSSRHALTQAAFRNTTSTGCLLFTMKMTSVTSPAHLDRRDGPAEGSSRTPAPSAKQQFCIAHPMSTRGAEIHDVELEGNPPGVILRAIDFRAAVERIGRKPLRAGSPPH